MKFNKLFFNNNGSLFDIINIPSNALLEGYNLNIESYKLIDQAKKSYYDALVEGSNIKDATNRFLFKFNGICELYSKFTDNKFKYIIEENMAFINGDKSVEECETKLNELRDTFAMIQEECIQLSNTKYNDKETTSYNNETESVEEAHYIGNDTEYNEIVKSMYIIECDFLKLDSTYNELKYTSILSESFSTERIDYINEAVKADIRTLIEKLLDNVARIFNKFITWARSQQQLNTKFLNANMDALLNTPLKPDTYIMYPYWDGVQELINAAVPGFAYSSLYESLESDETFINKHFAKYANKKSADSTYLDGAKILFRGNKVDKVKVYSRDLPLNKLIRFCLDYESLCEKTMKDMKELDKAGNEAINISKNMDTESHTTVKSAKDSEPATEPKEVESSNESYSLLLMNLVTEAVVEKVSTKAPEAKINNIQGEHLSGDDNGNALSDTKDDIERIRRYIRLCTNFLGTKMSVMQEEYKAYMYIIKDHYRVSVKKKSTTPTKVEDKEEETPEIKSGAIKSLMGRLKRK